MSSQPTEDAFAKIGEAAEEKIKIVKQYAIFNSTKQKQKAEKVNIMKKFNIYYKKKSFSK